MCIERGLAHFLLLSVTVLLVLSGYRDLKADECLQYEPHVELLRGVLRMKSYQNPRKDDVDKALVIVLELNAPICVRQRPGDLIDVGERDVWVLQVVYRDSQRAVLRGLINECVNLKGSLYHAHSAHHYENVLITTISVENVKEGCK